MSTETQKFGALIRFIDQPPAVLYHYTSMEGLLGILESGTIWATDIRYLNDKSEMTHLWDLVKIHIQQKLEDEKTPDRDFLKELLTGGGSLNVFVSCFSEDGDSLSQWRAYCPGGSGFSVGFHSAALGGIEFGKGFKQLVRVRYLADEAGASVDEVLQYAKAMANVTVSVNLVPGQPLTIGQAARGALSAVAPRFKHGAFAEEHEWRLILQVINQPGVGRKFRAGKSTLIPYVDVQLQAKDSFFIKEVIVGPTPETSLSVTSVNVLFQSINQPGVVVRESKVPYRVW